MVAPPNFPGVTSMWGASTNSVWAIGADGAIWFYDGTTFSHVLDAPAPLHAVSGRDANDVWAVGDLGTVSHWDGTTWSTSSL
jgi:hypothetical protein